MADSTEGNTDVQYLGLLAPALITLIAGLVIHSFIIGVNVTDWWKGRSVTPVDLIVTSLGIFRMCIQYVDTIYIFIATFFLNTINLSLTLVFADSIYNLFIYVNIGLSSLLSIYLKISILHTRLFLYLKGMIVHRTVYFIVAALLLSAFQCLIPLSMSITAVLTGETYNIAMYNLSMGCIFNNSVYYVTIGICVPLFFYCISSVLLITFLYHHTRKMKMSSNLSINLETYYSVMKFVSFTFICNTSNLITSSTFFLPDLQNSQTQESDGQSYSVCILFLIPKERCKNQR
ncbi:hypothetical protein GDO78_019096 [Eleutherodactylus coqui]|uniref:Taste receptor type 2 n=1 Tax=Eleutherodactylus coqui TaxID=57060 RepID=A0A8J6B6I4_ELECQ|nr:hypothetical protein GDO78_019096 [Eleutherodactylus coqui]